VDQAQTQQKGELKMGNNDEILKGAEPKKKKKKGKKKAAKKKAAKK
jgi:hypothetical protein